MCLSLASPVMRGKRMKKAVAKKVVVGKLRKFCTEKSNVCITFAAADRPVYW